MYTWKVNQHDSSPIYVNYKLSYIQNRKYIKEENNCGKLPASFPLTAPLKLMQDDQPASICYLENNVDDV